MEYMKGIRVRREFKNQPVNDMRIGMKFYNFKSKFEANWALYLQFLKEQGKIFNWDYENRTFEFPHESSSQRFQQYTPDFVIWEKERGKPYYQECKGYYTGRDTTRFRRLLRHYPDIIIELVTQNKLYGKQAKSADFAKKYVRRVINAAEIFRQVKGVISFV